MKSEYYLAFAGFAAPGRYGSSDCDGPYDDIEEFVVVIYVDLVHAHLHVSSINFNHIVLAIKSNLLIESKVQFTFSGLSEVSQ